MRNGAPDGTAPEKVLNRGPASVEHPGVSYESSAISTPAQLTTTALTYDFELCKVAAQRYHPVAPGPTRVDKNVNPDILNRR